LEIRRAYPTRDPTLLSRGTEIINLLFFLIGAPVYARLCFLRDSIFNWASGRSDRTSRRPKIPAEAAGLRFCPTMAGGEGKKLNSSPYRTRFLIRGFFGWTPMLFSAVDSSTKLTESLVDHVRFLGGPLRQKHLKPKLRSALTPKPGQKVKI